MRSSKNISDRTPLEIICQVLEVSRSGYYAWLERPESTRAKRREELAVKVKAIHQENRGVYGSPRVHQALAAAWRKCL